MFPPFHLPNSLPGIVLCSGADPNTPCNETPTPLATGQIAQVLDILKAFRIGSLSLEDMTENKAEADSDDPYAKASTL